MMYKNNCIILCAGDGERWGDYLGVPKHFIEIDGLSILERTIILLSKYPQNRVTVVAKNNDYKLCGSELYIPQNVEPYGNKCDKFASSLDLWHIHERNIVIMGDCYFTDEAIEAIVNRHNQNWNIFGREKPSQITGHGCGEIFAVSFDGEMMATMYDKLMQLNGILDNINELDVPATAWGLYHLIRDIDIFKLNNYIIDEHFIEINDWTDDFDCKIDYDVWNENYNKFVQQSVLTIKGRITN